MPARLCLRQRLSSARAGPKCVLFVCLHCMQNAADQIAANYRSIAGGEGPLKQYLVDRQHGY